MESSVLCEGEVRTNLFHTGEPQQRQNTSRIPCWLSKVILTEDLLPEDFVWFESTYVLDYPSIDMRSRVLGTFSWTSDRSTGRNDHMDIRWTEREISSLGIVNLLWSFTWDIKIWKLVLRTSWTIRAKSIGSGHRSRSGQLHITSIPGIPGLARAISESVLEERRDIHTGSHKWLAVYRHKANLIREKDIKGGSVKCGRMRRQLLRG
jgi:hypothetical protein